MIIIIIIIIINVIINIHFLFDTMIIIVRPGDVDRGGALGQGARRRGPGRRVGRRAETFDPEPSVFLGDDP